MGNFAPSNRENELRVEKLFLMSDFADKLEHGTVSLDDYMGFFWQFCPERLKHTQIFLEGVIQAKREGRPGGQ